MTSVSSIRAVFSCVLSPFPIFAMFPGRQSFWSLIVLLGNRFPPHALASDFIQVASPTLPPPRSSWNLWRTELIELIVDTRGVLTDCLGDWLPHETSSTGVYLASWLMGLVL